MMPKYISFILLVYAYVILSACSDQTTISQDQITSQRVVNVSAPAELVSLQNIPISAPAIPRTWEYKIEYLAPENSLVEAGQVVVRFDTQNLKNELITRRSALDAEKKEADKKALENQAKLEQLTLDLAEAKKDMDIAKRKVEITDVSRSEIERQKQQAEYKITKELYKQAQQRISQHKTSVEVSREVQQAKIDRAQTQVLEIEGSIEKMSVKAPKSGLVTLIPNGDDDKPAVGDSVYLGRKILTLPSLQKLAIKAEFDESDTAMIEQGKRVRVTLDAHPERPFTGFISELGQTYRNKSRNNRKIVFDAWIELDTVDLDIMRPGMNAKVELINVSSQS